MRESLLNIGIVGTGGVCAYGHFPAMKRAHGAELVALCDVNREACEAQAKLHHVPVVYGDYHELLADRTIDAIIIATPNHLHKPIALEALQAGKDVLCEKPLALTAADAAEVVAAARAGRRKLMVDFTHRFWNRSIKLKQAITQGRLGDVYYIRLGWLRRRGTPSWGAGGWFTRKSYAGGGCLIDIGCHMIDLALWLAGSCEAASVSGFVTRKLGRSGQASAHDAEAEEVEDFAAASITLRSGTHIHLEVAWALNLDRAKHAYIDVYGAEAGASWRAYGGTNGDPGPQLCFYRGEDPDFCIEAAQLEPEEPSEGWVRAVQHFIDCIKNDTEPQPSGECGLVTAAITEAIYESSRRGGAAITPSSCGKADPSKKFASSKKRCR